MTDVGKSMDVSTQRMQDDRENPRLLEITILAAPSLNVVNRILLQLNRRRIDVRRIVADFTAPSGHDFGDAVASTSQLLRLSIVALIPDDADVELIRKLINKLIDVYKVHQAIPA